MAESARNVASQEVGYVIDAQDYLFHLDGLPSVRVNQILVSENNSIAYVTAMGPGIVEAQILEGERPKPGQKFTMRDHGLELPTHVSLFGRAINCLGKPVDGQSPFPPGGEVIDLDTVAPGIDMREAVTEQFYTGIILIDTLLPIGKGQRELIIGDARSGKDLFLADTILNQKGRNVICVYVGIGKSEIEIRRLQDKIKRGGADEYTVILAATSKEPAPMIAIAPLVGASLAEHYAKKGQAVVLIVDDLATHAKYLREISLLANRIPGRESYPANIFYEHSQMVERAGNFLKSYGGGNITMIPVVETDLENMTNLITTNVMSMTDGHILFFSTMHQAGKFPAVDASKSVTRVGKQTMMLIHKILADKTMALLAEYAELERFSRFGSDLAAETQKTLKRGKVMQELISQAMGQFIDAPSQVLFLGLVFAGYYDDKDITDVHSRKQEILDKVRGHIGLKGIAADVKKYKFPELLEAIGKHMHDLDDLLPKEKTGKSSDGTTKESNENTTTGKSDDKSGGPADATSKPTTETPASDAGKAAPVASSESASASPGEADKQATPAAASAPGSETKPEEKPKRRFSLFGRGK